MQDHATHRQKLIEDIFAKLQPIEQAVADGSPRRSGRYIDGGDWLVQPGFALACLRKRLRRPSHQPILSGVSVKGLVRLCQSFLRCGTFLFDSRAAAVNVRQRVGSYVIRSFYPYTSQPATIKASSPGHSRLAVEVENRRIVEDIRHLRTPKVIATDFDAPCPFLMEEFVSGRIVFRRRDHTLLSQTLLPSLQRHYATFGVSSGPIKSCFGSDVRERVEQAAALLSWDQRWRDRRQFLSVVGRLADSERQFTISFCHGDLSVGHVAVSDDGQIFLLDWDCAGVEPIAYDLAKIERTCRMNQIRLYEECTSLLNEVSLPVKSNDLFSPAEQMFLASLREILVWERYHSLYEAQGSDPTAKLTKAFGDANELLKYIPD